MMKTKMKTYEGAVRTWAAFCLIWPPLTPVAADDSIEDAFRDALYAEEVDGDVESALKAYKEVSARVEHQRNLAAAALFRQGECLRKLGRNEDAVTAYEKLLSIYPDRERLVNQARTQLAALGVRTKEGPSKSITRPSGAVQQELARLKEMVENSPDLLNAAVNDQPPPLHSAAAAGQLEVAKFLLDNNAKIDLEWRQNWDVHTPLQMAARAGHKAMCELLINRGADIKTDGSHAFAIALKNDREAVARLLLEKGADPNATIEWAWSEWAHSRRPVYNNASALIIASGGEFSLEFCEALLEAGADPNYVTTTKYRESSTGGKSGGSTLHVTSPLKRAILARDLAKVNLLLKAGAKPNAEAGDDGQYVLCLALARAKLSTPTDTSDPIIDALLDAGAKWKLAVENRYGGTVLHTAARANASGWMRKAIAAGVEVDARDRGQQTALHLATSYFRPECLQLLLEAGADANVTDSEGRTALHRFGRSQITSMKNQGRGDDVTRCLQLLLEAGADADAVWISGDSEYTPLALMIDSWFENDEFWPAPAIMLLERGVNPRIGSLLSHSMFKGSTPPSNVAPLFEKVWRAAHFDPKNNPARPDGVWRSQGMTNFEARATPYFACVLSKNSATGPGTLRRFVKLTYQLAPGGLSLTETDSVVISRLTRDEDEPKTYSINFAEHLKSEKIFELRWGDIVEIPTSVGGSKLATHVAEFFSAPDDIEVRVEIGENHVFANADRANGPVVRVRDENSSLTREAIRLRAGISPYFILPPNLYRPGKDGELLAAKEPVRHGDVLRFPIGETKPALSTQALRTGMHICQNPEGPFWTVSSKPRPIDWIEGGNIAGLILALGAPNGLPLKPINWDAAYVRQWTGKESHDTPIHDAIVSLDLRLGTLVVVPPSETPASETPERLRLALTKALNLTWNLGIYDQPYIQNTYTPPFFRSENKGGQRIWRDASPDDADRPLLPIAEDLVTSHPQVNFRSVKLELLDDEHVILVSKRTSTRLVPPIPSSIRTPSNPSRPSRVRRIPTPPSR